MGCSHILHLLQLDDNQELHSGLSVINPHTPLMVAGMRWHTMYSMVIYIQFFFFFFENLKVVNVKFIYILIL